MAVISVELGDMVRLRHSVVRGLLNGGNYRLVTYFDCYTIYKLVIAETKIYPKPKDRNIQTDKARVSFAPKILKK